MSSLGRTPPLVTWTGFMRRASLSVMTSASIIFAMSAYGGEPVEILLWADGDVVGMKNVVEMDGHPCGQVAIVRVTRLPPIDAKPLQPDKVVEIDANGEALRAWATPVDSVPVAVLDDSLVVEVPGTGRFYAVRQSREIEEVSAPSPNQASHSSRVCPKVTAFGNSAYLQCGTFVDALTGKRRLLTFQSVCT